MFFSRSQIRIFAAVVAFCVPINFVAAAAYTHSPSTLSDKVIGDSLSITDYNTIRTALENFYYDNANNYLGLGSTNPSVTFDVTGGVRIRDFSSAGIVKNDADGNLSGGNTLSGSDIGGFTEGSIIFADSSGNLTEDNAKLNWDGTSINVAGNIIPDGTNYTLGTPAKPWKEMYVSSNSLNIGGTKLSKDSSDKLFWNNLPLSPRSLASVNVSNGTVSNEFALFVDLVGRVGLGTTAPKGFLDVPVGSGDVPSMVLTSGSLITNPVKNALENSGEKLYYTNATPVRMPLATENYVNTAITTASEWTETAGILAPTTGTDDVAVDTDTLFVDVSEDKVGIGMTDPDVELELAGSFKLVTPNQSACSAAEHGGKIEYIDTGSQGAFWGCLRTGSGSSDFAWVHLDVFAH